MKLAPKDLVAHERLAQCLFWQAKPREAYEVLKKAKQIDRENAEKNATPEVFLTPEAIMAQFYERSEDMGGGRTPET
ncbi:MAG: hypothetical protein ACLP9L_09030 [Thermoguttaceae bacterium]